MSLSLFDESEIGEDRLISPLLLPDEESRTSNFGESLNDDADALRKIDFFTLLAGLEWQGYGSYKDDKNIWFATLWSRLLNVLFVIGTIAVIVNLFIDLVQLSHKGRDGNNLLLANLSYGVGSLIQNGLCFASLRVWRRAKKQRIQLHRYCPEVSLDAFNSARRQMQPISGFIMIFTIMTCVLLVITSDSSIKYHFAVNVFYSITSIIPYSIIICGLATMVFTTLLYLEHYLQAFHERLSSGEVVSCAEYLYIHKRFQQIWKPQTQSAYALACLLLSTAWNVFNRTLVLLLIYPYYLHTTSTDQSSMFIIALLFVGRELIVLTLILDKIGRINAQALKLHRVLVRQRWIIQQRIGGQRATSETGHDLSRNSASVRPPISTRDSLSISHFMEEDEVEHSQPASTERISLRDSQRRKRHLPDVTATSAATPMSLMFVENDQREMERLSLCLLIVDTPLTVTLFGMQFSLSQLRLQFLVVLGGFLLAFLRAILIAQFRF